MQNVNFSKIKRRTQRTMNKLSFIIFVLCVLGVFLWQELFKEKREDER